ncbi:MAG: S1C family serine protease [Pirellulales bacterium]
MNAYVPTIEDPAIRRFCDRATDFGDASPRENVPNIVRDAQLKQVKIYGAGGFKGLEAYQSGFLISDEGHILTVYSYVLDSDYITATLDDGAKFEAKLIGADPKMEVAVLKIDPKGHALSSYDLSKAVVAGTGARVLAHSNLYGVATGDEPVSVQRGVISSRSNLEARRGGYDTLYNGPVYVLDAMTNNPGAAGGALTNWRGELLGMLGKELRNSRNNLWLNYAVPVSELIPAVERIKSGKAPPVDNDHSKPLPNHLTLKAMGFVLIPNVLERTPPFVDEVRPESIAAKAGLKSDDLILFIDDQLVQSCQAFQRQLERIEIDTPIKLTIMRESELRQELLEVTIQVPAAP